MSISSQSPPVSLLVWNERYRLNRHGHPVEDSPQATLERVARALASREPDRDARYKEFLGVLADYRFLPAGRILAGAGADADTTLFSCFSMGSVGGSAVDLLDSLKETAVTLDLGGGAGIDFSRVRPAGQRELSGSGISGGPLPALRLWECAARELGLGGHRPAAMMGTLRADHPDIAQFIDAKRDRHALPHFNLSVLATDDFMRAVEQGGDWATVFPASHLDPQRPAALHERAWCGWDRTVSCREYARLPAALLFDAIADAAYECGEPGLVFIDRMQRQDNLAYAERVAGTNPCGEVPLPRYGACNLGSLNLPRFVRRPFEPDATLDFAGLEAAAATAVRMLDNVYDLSGFPLPVQAKTARRSRRLGIGITGLADALVMLGAPYDSERALALAEEIMRRVAHAAYRASALLARERGSFPCYMRDAYLASPFVAALPGDIRDSIAVNGMRNSHLTAIAPAGSISLFAGAVSSGIEPLHAARYERRIGLRDGGAKIVAVDALSVRLWRALGRDGVPHALREASGIAPEQHLAMQAALQRHVDNAIAKTIALPEDYPRERFKRFMRSIHASGVKGCTVYRDRSRAGPVRETPCTEADRPPAQMVERCP